MALNAAQRRIAQLIFSLAIGAGLSAPRAHELQAASYAESGLNPNATNKSSGAAGLFQLLSSGYRQRAQQLGGLYNPTANTKAIINDYVRYWQQHPNAAPGEAARDVERSGEGAGFYSGPLRLVAGIGGGGGATTADTAGRAPGPPSGSAPDLVRQSILKQLMAGGDINFDALAQARRKQGSMLAQSAAQNPGPTARRAAAGLSPQAVGTGGLAEAFYDPLGQYDNGRFSSQGIGGHSDHVHLSITNPKSMLAAIAYAQAHGLRVGENPYTDQVDPVHVKGSYHYRDFPGTYKGRRLGEAIDVSGSPSAMAGYYKWATSTLR